MSGFSADWLSLREAADHKARHNEVTDSLVRLAAGKPSLSILDLGTGTGSNLRFLAPLLGTGQRWNLIDNDAALLATLPGRLASWAALHGYSLTGTDSLQLSGPGFSACIDRSHADLAAGIAPWLSNATDLVTASALLDLVSAEWVSATLQACKRYQSMACFTLNYDGRVSWQPPVSDDESLRRLLNAHQRQQKGLGLALGPEAASVTAARMDALGFQVVQAHSDWVLDAGQASLQQSLAAGWVEAATEQEAGFAKPAAAWLEARQLAALTRESQVVVGHIDVLGLPSQQAN